MNNDKSKEIYLISDLVFDLLKSQIKKNTCADESLDLNCFGNTLTFQIYSFGVDQDVPNRKTYRLFNIEISYKQNTDMVFTSELDFKIKQKKFSPSLTFDDVRESKKIYQSVFKSKFFHDVIKKFINVTIRGLNESYNLNLKTLITELNKQIINTV